MDVPHLLIYVNFIRLQPVQPTTPGNPPFVAKIRFEEVPTFLELSPEPSSAATKLPQLCKCFFSIVL